MNLSNFAERLAELAFDAQLNTTQLSTELGCGEATISRYMTGKSYPTVALAVRLADYFNCTVDYVLGVDDENRASRFRECPPFGERLLEICKERNLSRYKLQQMTDIPESVIRYWVRGITHPSIANILKIADALECTVDYLLGREI